MIIDKWQKTWSVWLTTAAIILSEAYQYLPDIREAIPADWYRYAFLIILVARLCKQRS